ncbi:hypothetical protein SELMODRAFT_431923 [Selaginella moellendorffii]|uniref:Thioredoxin domain-containing protein n=1 Tax=Selaginella moellendorffii TaxID=88036 RepID=D8TEE3_SELML|nr:hypothetical protein SELMODRAFT_431923 [Selaginella moellendorffii]
MLFVIPAEVLEGQVNLLRVELGEVQLTKLLGGKSLVPLFLANTVEERAFPFRREAAKKDSELMSFGCVLWRQEEASILKSWFGLELAPAVVFIKDPGVQPITVNCVTPSWKLWKNIKFMLQSITASKLGCDPADFSAAGKDVETCQNFAAATAYKDKHLSLSWLDGEMQKKFCYYCLPSEPVHETCRPRQYQEPDLASMLIAPYSDANEISENTKSMPALIPEEQAVLMLSSTRNAIVHVISFYALFGRTKREHYI